MNALLGKAEENGIRLGGRVRFLDMQLQERQYIVVVQTNSATAMIDCLAKFQHRRPEQKTEC